MGNILSRNHGSDSSSCWDTYTFGVFDCWDRDSVEIDSKPADDLFSPIVASPPCRHSKVWTAQFSALTSHVPKQLIQQIVFEWVKGLLDKDIRHFSDASFKISHVKPSCQRFHGCLLFIDISGFTSLSARTNPDEFRKIINDYFSSLLHIIEQREGDVIKFAGDAMFVVWQAKENTRSALSASVKRAVACGNKINVTCNNRRVDIIATNDIESKLEKPVLNVHSAVSAGTFVGIDVGSESRWEYFIVGQPILDVALCIDQATAGKLAISPLAHELLHHEDVAEVAELSDNKCRCGLVQHGCYMYRPTKTHFSEAKLFGIGSTKSFKFRSMELISSAVDLLRAAGNSDEIVDMKIMTGFDDNLRVLVVDDANVSRGVIRRVLDKRLGHKVVEVSDEIEAIRLIEKSVMAMNGDQSTYVADPSNMSEDEETASESDNRFDAVFVPITLMPSTCKAIGEISGFSGVIFGVVEAGHGSSSGHSAGQRVLLKPLQPMLLTQLSADILRVRRKSQFSVASSPRGTGSEYNAETTTVESEFYGDLTALGAEPQSKSTQERILDLKNVSLEAVQGHVHEAIRASELLGLATGVESRGGATALSAGSGTGTDSGSGSGSGVGTGSGSGAEVAVTSLDSELRTVVTMFVKVDIDLSLQLGGEIDYGSVGGGVGGVGTAVTVVQENISLGGKATSAGEAGLNAAQLGTVTADLKNAQADGAATGKPTTPTTTITTTTVRTNAEGTIVMEGGISISTSGCAQQPVSPTVNTGSSEVSDHESDKELGLSRSGVDGSPALIKPTAAPTNVVSPTGSSSPVASTVLARPPLQRDVSVRSNRQYEELNELCGFAPRSETETAADEALLNRLQSCMEVLVGAFQTHGGQLRQFIVDDKGCVGIGTFGLRGSMNEDNSAAAVDAGHLVITRFVAIGLNASIGISKGEAYSGLIGSSSRHEFGVMGKSINLSARLMCKAELGSVLCDAMAAKSDRLHSYVALPAVKAKGYSNLVPIFRPILIAASPAYAAWIDAMASDCSLYGRAGVLEEILGVVMGHTSHIQKLVDTAKAAQERSQAPTRTLKRFASTRKKLLMAAHTVVAVNRLVSGAHTKNKWAELMRNLTHKAPTEPKPRQELNKMKIVLIQGDSGIGKSAILNCVEKLLSIESGTKSAVQSSQPSHPHVFFKGLGSRSDNLTHFLVWKPIIIAMMSSVALTVGDPTIAETSDEGNVSTTTKGMIMIIDEIPKDLETYIPIMAYICLDDRAHAHIMDNHLDKAVQFLAAVIQIACDKLHAKPTSVPVTVVVIDDIEHIDSASCQLLEYLWRYSDKLLIVATESCRASEVDHADASSAADALESFSEVIVSKLRALEAADSDRFFKIRLAPLSRAATGQVVEKVVISRSYVDISTDYRQINRIIDLIHSLSGGNPLYCRDLATSVVRSSSSLAVAQEHLEELKRNFKPDNMDELICYSLDQLALHLQAILKFASVAGVRGACFCAEDLMVLVKASSSSHADTVEEVSEMLASIRSECGFLQLLGKDELDPKAFFQFSNTVYQRLLYGLILKDTKISLHKVYGEYLESSLIEQMRVATISATDSLTGAVAETDVAPITAAAFNTQAQHWLLAECWPSAFAAFSQCAIMLDRTGYHSDAKVYFCEAFNILQIIRQSVGMSIDHAFAMEGSNCVLKKCDRISMRMTHSQSSSTIFNFAQSERKHSELSLRSLNEGTTGAVESLIDSSSDSPYSEARPAALEAAHSSDLNLHSIRLTDSISFDSYQLDSSSEVDLAARHEDDGDAAASMARWEVYNLFQGDEVALQLAVVMLLRFAHTIFLTLDSADREGGGNNPPPSSIEMRVLLYQCKELMIAAHPIEMPVTQPFSPGGTQIFELNASLYSSAGIVSDAILSLNLALTAASRVMAVSVPLPTTQLDDDDSDEGNEEDREEGFGLQKAGNQSALSSLVSSLGGGGGIEEPDAGTGGAAGMWEQPLSAYPTVRDAGSPRSYRSRISFQLRDSDKLMSLLRDVEAHIDIKQFEGEDS